MRPPGHSGKAKKGHLCFDAIFEAGENIKNTKIIINNDAEIKFRKPRKS